MISNTNIKVDPSLCYACGICVERCIMDNLRLSVGPCRAACPLNMNCQGYLRLLARGKASEAAEEMRRQTPFGAILGRICSHPCEADCERGRVDGPVHIRAVKRYLADDFPEVAFRPAALAGETGSSVAVIGSGPAGLTAAYYLRAEGHRVTVYDAEEKPGGLLRYGIPDYRLPPGVVDRTLEMLKEMGVVFITETVVGADVGWSELEAGNQAVVLAGGAGPSVNLDLPGQESDRVIDALDLLKGTASGIIEPGRSAVIIGGGNTAVDAALTAKLLGAGEVRLVALEPGDKMPAYEQELSEAREVGVEIINGKGPTSFESLTDGRVQISFSDCLSLVNAQGFFEPVLAKTCSLTIQADAVVLAVGQRQRADGWPDGLFSPGKRLPVADPLTRQLKARDQYFVCGDMAAGPSSVVEAMASAKEAAVSADRYLKGEGLTWGRDPWQGGLVKEFKADHSRAQGGGRGELERLKPGDMGLGRETEQTLKADSAVREAERCLSCGRSFEMNRTCWYCLPCEIECPVRALEVRMPYLVR